MHAFCYSEKYYLKKVGEILTKNNLQAEKKSATYVSCYGFFACKYQDKIKNTLHLLMLPSVILTHNFIMSRSI